MPIKRNLLAKALSALDNFPVVAILGPRQCGKTTFVKDLMPDWKYFDIENPNDFELISRDPIFFFEQYPSNVILDEAQEYPDLFKALRGVIDANRNKRGRFLITGSSSPDLMNHLSETLAGRIAILKLGSLTVNEVYEKPLSDFYEIFNSKLDRNNLIFSDPRIHMDELHNIWLKGGYPEPILQEDQTFYMQWMQNYRDTYVNRDLAKLFPRLNKFAYQQFLSVLSKLSGTIINKADLARALEVSQATINEYINIASGTFLWRQIPAFSSNKIKSLVKMPKGHLRDTGILHYLLKINDMDSLFTSPKIGLSFESFVIEQILKNLETTNVMNWEAYYYRTHSGAEIDLILDGPFGILPIEIKFGTSVRAKQLMAVENYVKDFNLPFGIVINQSKEIQWVTPNIIQIPANYL